MSQPCASTRDVIARRVDDPVAGGAALDAHLASCAACAAALEEHRRVARLLSASKPVVPAGLAARLAKKALDPALAKLLFWRDVESTSRVALRAAVVLLVASTAFAALVTFSNARDAGMAANEPRVVDAASLDDTARLTIAPAPDALDALLEEVR